MKKCLFSDSGPKWIKTRWENKEAFGRKKFQAKMALGLPASTDLEELTMERIHGQFLKKMEEAAEEGNTRNNPKTK